MKKVIHIGLAKAASTSLQKHVFPEFLKSQKTEYLSETVFELISDPTRATELPDHFLASYEGLVGNQNWWDRNQKTNQAFFGADTTVLLILRRPSDYLQSVYQQVCHQNGLLLDPKTYFCDPESGQSDLYAPEGFDQNRLIELYTKNFHEVIVQKMESIADLEFLRIAYGVSETEMAAARLNMTKRTSNRSFSKTAAAISMKLKWMFGKPTIDLETGIIKRTLRYQLWRDLMQGVFDKVYPYKKFVIDWDKIPNVDIDEMNATYDEIPQFTQFIDGIPQPNR